MYDSILKTLRQKIRSRQYVMTLHAEEEMVDDGFSIFDAESCVLTGLIIERQKDAATAEWKYVIKGEALTGDSMCIVGEISPTGKLVFITVYRV